MRRPLFVFLVAATTDSSAAVEEECGIYLLNQRGSLSLYAGKAYSKFEQIGTEETVLPFVDPNMNEYSPWNDWVENESMIPEEIQPKYENILKYFVSGLGSLPRCSSIPNIKSRNKEYRDEDVHGTTHSGSSNIYNYVFETIKDIHPGELLTVECSDGPNDAVPIMVLGVDIIKSNGGVCLDNLLVKKNEMGRGAFARKDFEKGQVIATSPLVHFDRSQMDIVRQMRKDQHVIPVTRDHKIEYQNSQILGRQIVLNYCYGNPHSNLLLLPLAPGVNSINHSSQPNVQVRWKSPRYVRENIPLMELLEEDYTAELVIEYVATRAIPKDTELFMDYGFDLDRLRKASGDDDFRHEIYLPDHLYSENWNKTDPRPYGDFIASKVGPGQMAPVRWNDGTAQVVTPWAFRIGLESRVRHVLLEYCNRMGIIDIFQHVTTDGNALLAGTEGYMTLEGDQWYLQRPASQWRSNLHWFSPGDGAAHEHYLQALSVAGFDKVLESIGDYLGMDGLVVFHVTFIAVSFSNKGFLHHDVIDTGGKVYNVIIPLILANETGPELDLQEFGTGDDDEENLRVGRYRYEYDVASMQGDGSEHATSACDYRTTHEMRLAATVYIADVNDSNLQAVMDHYTQAYPPSNDIELLKSWKARHWKRGDPSRKLPPPEPNHILVRDGGLPFHWIGDSPSEEL